jgi:hypothetical protein
MNVNNVTHLFPTQIHHEIFYMLCNEMLMKYFTFFVCLPRGGVTKLNSVNICIGNYNKKKGKHKLGTNLRK